MKETKSNGGYWMLFGLFALLAAPIVVDHIIHPAPAEAAVTTAAN